jgi:predicted nucleic acid-binding protein
MIIVDANALFPASLRDTLFRLQEAGIVEVRLSAQIWDEVTRNLLITKRMTAEQVAHLNRAAGLFFTLQNMLVTDYERHIAALTCDPKDRHVLAAAIQAHANTVVTMNLTDFPAASLEPYGIIAEHPDVFLDQLYNRHAEALAELLRHQAADKMRPPQTVEQLLDTLAKHVPRFAARIRGAFHLGTDASSSPSAEIGS